MGVVRMYRCGLVGVVRRYMDFLILLSYSACISYFFA